MGKYSLDAFEVHPLMKLRPKMAAPNNVRFAPTALPSESTSESVLILRPVSSEDPNVVFDQLSQVRKQLSPRQVPKALVAEAGHVSRDALPAIAQAYVHCFPDLHLLTAPDDPLLPYLPEAGLWLDLTRGILPLRLAVAKNHQEDRWQSRPVYAFVNQPLTTEIQQVLTRWHCTACNVPGPWGAKMALRRLMFPRELTSGADVPFRMWWQNLGTSPLYAPANALLVLEKDGKQFSLTGSAPVECRMGDATCNPMLKLPELPDGAYSLLCALEARGKRLPLCMDTPNRNGLYMIGTVNLDHMPRPYLRTMWRDQYADGYYPLEDPAAPEEGGTQ